MSILKVYVRTLQILKKINTMEYIVHKPWNNIWEKGIRNVKNEAKKVKWKHKNNGNLKKKQNQNKKIEI